MAHMTLVLRVRPGYQAVRAWPSDDYSKSGKLQSLNNLRLVYSFKTLWPPRGIILQDIEKLQTKTRFTDHRSYSSLKLQYNTHHSN